MSAPRAVGDYFSIREHMTGTAQPAVFVFGGYRFPLASYVPLVRRLRKAGLQCVLYAPKRSLIGVGIEYAEVVRAAHLAAANVNIRIAKLSQQSPASAYRAFGISLGTAFALEVTKQCPAIDRAVLVAPFGDFAEHLEAWSGQWHFDKIVRSQPTDIRGSGKVLNRVGWRQNLVALEGKQLLLYRATKDKLVHTASTQHMLDELQATGISHEVITREGGHFRPIFHLSRDGRYLEFLRAT